jgi:nicotinate-nucleotide adenylyltransferase
MKSIAIFGGTFNPVHKGHTRLLKLVTESVKLDRIFVMPSKIPPHKAALELADETDRLEMCRLAFEDFANVTVSDYEFTREGKSYSYYTVKHFCESFPGSRIYFIMGSDMLLSFETWYRADELIKMCTPICISRSKEDTAAAREHAEKLSVDGEAVFLEAEPFEVSSTQIRQMFAQKNFTNLYCYLDENVVKYIMNKNLYGQG